MTQQHWLRANETTDICWAVFECNGKSADILAVIGATGLVDRRNVSPEEARTEWKRLIDAGWHHAKAAEVSEAKMNKRLLKIYAYD